MTAILTAPADQHLDLTRCDRCGAAGKTLFVLPSGTDLVFCGHHARVYWLGLPGTAVRVELDR